MSFESTTDQLRVQLDERVATLTLNRPEARNALSPELSAELIRAIAWCGDTTDVGAVLLTGAGTAFCSGADVKAMGKRAAGPPPTAQDRFREMQARHHGIGGALYGLRKPTIAALPGAAAGAGMSIALCCDFRVAASTAFLTTAYARIGLSGDYGIAWLLTRIVGPGRARELLLLCERIDAEQALAMGLVTQVVAPDELQGAAGALALRLANGPSVAFAYMKDNLDDALGISHGEAIEREADRVLKTNGTADHKEAVAAFAEKRDPVFQGR